MVIITNSNIHGAPLKVKLDPAALDQNSNSVLNQKQQQKLDVSVNTNGSNVNADDTADDTANDTVTTNPDQANNATQAAGKESTTISTSTAQQQQQDPDAEGNGGQDQGGDDTNANPADDDGKEDDQGGDDALPADGQKDDPTNSCCTPTVDVNASVVESYKRHRAQVAVIGDFGSCGPKTSNETTYSWTIDWGDDSEEIKHLDHIAPFQSVHTYAKKGKVDVEVTFCSHLDGCESGCDTFTKKIPVKP